jgi:hypothetical protein
MKGHDCLDRYACAAVERLVMSCQVRLDDEIQHIPVLIYSAPEVVQRAIYHEEDFIQVPWIARSGTPAPELIGKILAKLQTSLANGLICDDDSPSEQQLFDIAVTEAAAEIQPHRMADDLGWEAVILGTVGRWSSHTTNMAHQQGVGQVAHHIDNAEHGGVTMYVKTQVVKPWFTTGARRARRRTSPVSTLQAVLAIVVISGGLWQPTRTAAANIAQPQVQCPVTICGPVGTEFPSQVTLFSEAGLWGDRLTIEAPVSEPIETVRLATNTDLAHANLLKRISSIRLQCGSREAQVVLFTAANMWSEFGKYARPFYCAPGQTVDINLHTEAPELADQVGSVYFVAHARQAHGIPLSDLVTDAWTEQLADLPSGAKADGGPRLQLIAFFAFALRQDLKLNHWACTERSANLRLFASLNQDGFFSVSVSETYVGDGTGDAWGCRGKMEDKLETAAANAAHELRDGLNALMALVGDRPRYYLAPTWSIREFDLYAGGEPAGIEW